MHGGVGLHPFPPPWRLSRGRPLVSSCSSAPRADSCGHPGLLIPGVRRYSGAHGTGDQRPRFDEHRSLASCGNRAEAPRDIHSDGPDAARGAARLWNRARGCQAVLLPGRRAEPLRTAERMAMGTRVGYLESRGPRRDLHRNTPGDIRPPRALGPAHGLRVDSTAAARMIRPHGRSDTRRR
jgi:hypothetical protein